MSALDVREQFGRIQYWPTDTMVAVWLFFTAMLFVIEPLNHPRAAGRSPPGAGRTFARIEQLHWIVLAVSLITIAGAVAGSLGYLLFTH